MSKMNVTDETLKCNLEEWFVYNRTTNEETTKRYLRLAKKRDNLKEWVALMEVSSKLKKKFTKDEIKIIARSKRQSLPKTKKIDFKGKVLNIATCGDLHSGGKYFHEDIWNAFVEEANKPEIDIVLITGDITDGFYNNRMDALLELLYLGYEAQKDYAVSQLSKIKKPMYIIDGNHDTTYKKQNGALIVKDICKEIPNAIYMGENEATLNIRGIDILLWHGLDAGGNAISQRPQNVINAMDKDSLPQIAILAHTHKQCFLHYRGVYIISGGAITEQSDWMRRTNKLNHTGFSLIKATINNNKVTHLNYDWFPCKTNEITD